MKLLRLEKGSSLALDETGGWLARESSSGPSFCRAELSGRLSEISGRSASAMLTLAMGLVVDTQREGDPAAWIMVGDDTFYPPDAARAGVDLSSLAVIRAPEEVSALKACSRLLRSGGFGLVIVDLSRVDPSMVRTGMLTRLVGLSQTHDTAVVFLTEKGEREGSLDSLIGFRGYSSPAESLGHGRFRCELEVVKDKRRGPYWSHRAQYVGPPGIW